MWYLINAARFRAEQEALRELVAEVNWLEVDGWCIDAKSHLCVNAELRVSERSFPVTLRYSANFPFTPPSVAPRTPERWSDHQYGRDELCLEYGPDNWRQEITGADMLRSAERLLRTQANRAPGVPDVPSRHATTPGQDLRPSFVRLLITEPLSGFLRARPRGHTTHMKFWALSREKSYVVLAREVTDPDGTTWTDPSVPAELERYCHKWGGLLFSLPEGVVVPDLATGAELIEYLKALGFAPPDGYVAEDLEFILVQGDATPQLFWLGKDGDVYRHPGVSSGAGQRLDADHVVLGSKTVGVVGCGSVGSKIATMLSVSTQSDGDPRGTWSRKPREIREPPHEA
jgi:sulfur-carrier protein adenylyltransferase/sulfurtransferase